MMIAPKNAAENVVTLKPLMTVPKYQNINPFKNKENTPSVTMFIGRVRMLTIGFTNMLNKVKHAPTIRATQTGASVIPETIYVVASTATDKRIQCKMIFIFI